MTCADGDNGGVDLDSVADELYGLALSDFTPTRNARAKQARADGDPALATQIQQLAKPTTSAWLVNALARELGEELEPLISLGRDLREASSNLSGDELRALTRQRHQVVHALVQQARSVGAAAGQRVSETVANEVRQTLDASLADAGVAEAVLSGRLTQPAEYAGFGEPTGISWHGQSRRRPTRRQATPGGDAGAEVADLTAHRRASAEKALNEAARRLRSAQSARESARQDRERAARELEVAEQRVEQLRTDLAGAERDVTGAEDAIRAAGETLGRAEEAARKADTAHEEAAANLAALE